MIFLEMMSVNNRKINLEFALLPSMSVSVSCVFLYPILIEKKRYYNLVATEDFWSEEVISEPIKPVCMSVCLSFFQHLVFV